MKKLLCVLCALMLLASSAMIFASAMPAPYLVGDANGVGGVDIRDATYIQKYAAKLIDSDRYSNPYSKFLADINADGEITVKDATLIQKSLAGIENAIRGSYPDIAYRGFYANYDSGKAMAGVPVTFTAVADSVEEFAEPLTYELYVDGKLIENSYKESFTYTFETEGLFEVTIKCINGFGHSAKRTAFDYEVVKPYASEKPVIKAFYPDQLNFYSYSHDGVKGDVTYTAEVIFGEGDYQYEFLLDGEVIQKYSSKNTYVFTEAPKVKIGEPYVITVRVKDSSTKDEFVSQSYEFWAEI